MNTQELQALIAVIETGSFTKAASRLGRVQSSVSQRIKSLEDKLGIVLLERGTPVIAPTKGGLTVYEYAKKISKMMRECRTAICETEKEDCIIIGIIECLPSVIADKIIDISDNIGINVELSMGSTRDLIESMNNSLIDMAIVGSGFLTLSHTRSTLFTDTLLLTTESEADDIKSLREFNGETFLVSSKRASSIRNIEMLLRTAVLSQSA